MSGPRLFVMIHLFIAPEQIGDGIARISGPSHLHLARVLRVQPGQSVVLLDNKGNAFLAVLVAVERAGTVARIEASLTLRTEPSVHITVAQALGRCDKFEQVIKHGTEVGAAAFIPIRAERSVMDIPAGKLADRLVRWRQIARGAAEQSQRAIIPHVAEPISLMQLLSTTTGATPVLLLHPSRDAEPLATALQQCFAERTSAALVVVIGPEGGWSNAELALSAKPRPSSADPVMVVNIGPRILRTETAALVAVSQILYHIETTGFGEQACAY